VDTDTVLEVFVDATKSRDGDSTWLLLILVVMPEWSIPLKARTTELSKVEERTKMERIAANEFATIGALEGDDRSHLFLRVRILLRVDFIVKLTVTAIVDSWI
jgi:hypothetical protein